MPCSRVTMAEVQDRVPPTMEAITTPRITQHIMIIIFFCGVFTMRGKRLSNAAEEQRKAH